MVDHAASRLLQAELDPAERALLRKAAFSEQALPVFRLLAHFASPVDGDPEAIAIRRLLPADPAPGRPKEDQDSYTFLFRPTLARALAAAHTADPANVWSLKRGRRTEWRAKRATRIAVEAEVLHHMAAIVDVSAWIIIPGSGAAQTRAPHDLFGEAKEVPYRAIVDAIAKAKPKTGSISLLAPGPGFLTIELEPLSPRRTGSLRTRHPKILAVSHKPDPSCFVIDLDGPQPVASLSNDRARQIRRFHDAFRILRAPLNEQAP